MRNRRGFTLIELLIAVNLSILLLNLMIMSLSVLQRADMQIGMRQNLNGIFQLRQKFALCRIKKVTQNKLSCSFNNNDYDFLFEHNRLVMKPGYVVYLEEIRQGRFTQKNHTLTLDFTVGGKAVHAILAYVE